MRQNDEKVTIDLDVTSPSSFSSSSLAFSFSDL
jgi:hypothetical protein